MGLPPDECEMREVEEDDGNSRLLITHLAGTTPRP